MNRILREQQEEVQAFHKYKERESAKLKKEHRLQSDLICTVHDNPLVRLDMLKMVDEDFARKMDEHDRWMDNRQRKLVVRHQGVRKEEEWMKAHMLEQVKSGQLSEPLVEEPLLDSGLGQDNMDICEHSGVHDVMGNKAPMSGPSETENVNVVMSEPAQLTVLNGIMAEIPARDPNDVAQGLPIGTDTATVQSSGRSAVTSESDVMKDKVLGRGTWAGFEQHSRAANSDSACLISSTQQNQINLPSLPQSRTNLEHDISVSSLQVPSIDHNEPTVSGAVGSEETRGCEGHSSPQPIEVALPQPADATSLQVEQSNDNVTVSQLVVQSQPPQSEDPSICHNQPIRHSEKENEHDLSRCSSPEQTDMATQQAVEVIPPRTEESNHSVSQPVQLVVQLQPPQSEDPTICHNQPIRHSVVESEHELSRSSSFQQNDVAMQQAVEAIPPRIEQSNHSVSQPVQLVVQLQSPQSEDTFFPTN
ncbi:uncharacterized protein LOC131247019 [Magnolia sinica]|uniref:uncharacterized protein LOC131247019 n=1 Tax=Magnolia sinica TaxID=86752 RepID=UPI00265B0DA7|nr:uncharacterized protein LOC131247019 [Magnolia sinica]